MKTVLLVISLLLILSGLAFAQTMFNRDGSSDTGAEDTLFQSGSSSSTSAGDTSPNSDSLSSTRVGDTSSNSDSLSSTREEERDQPLTKGKESR